MVEINSTQLFSFFIYNFQNLIKAAKHHGLHELFLVAKRTVEAITLAFILR